MPCREDCSAHSSAGSTHELGNLSDGTECQGSVAVDFTVAGTWKAGGATGTFKGVRTVALAGTGGASGSAGAGGAGGTSSSACNPLVIRVAAEEPTCASYAAICSASADCLALGCCFGGCPLLAGASREACVGKCWKAYPAVAQIYFDACDCADRHVGASECMDGRPPVAKGGTGGGISVPDAGVPPSSCGNGRLDSSETCDDANRASNDGCGATCTLEAGFICPVVGKPCQPLSICGDGILSPGETCDDGKTVAGDGCAGTCLVEPGYKCDGQPSVCTRTVCGDYVVEGGESCDDGNALSGDGCSQTCQLEPSCTGATCKIRCGDGIIVTGEVCDDGNTTDGDGCSSQCSIEAGWTCKQIPSAISSYSKTSCQSTCGDGVATGTEECDNGAANQDNGAACTTQCKWSRPK